MEGKEEVRDFEEGQYSGVAWMVSEFYMNTEDRINDKVTHVCTEKFNFVRASMGDIQQLADQGYGVNVSKIEEN